MTQIAKHEYTFEKYTGIDGKASEADRRDIFAGNTVGGGQVGKLARLVEPEQMHVFEC